MRSPSRRTKNAIFMAVTLALSICYAIWPTIWLGTPLAILTLLVLVPIFYTLARPAFYWGKILPSYSRGYHLPLWIDLVFYICIGAAFSHTRSIWLLIPWTTIMAEDFRARCLAADLEEHVRRAEALPPRE